MHLKWNDPRTGTGIGRRNMPAFTTFVSMICVCLIFDVSPHKLSTLCTHALTFLAFLASRTFTTITYTTFITSNTSRIPHLAFRAAPPRMPTLSAVLARMPSLGRPGPPRRSYLAFFTNQCLGSDHHWKPTETNGNNGNQRIGNQRMNPRPTTFMITNSSVPIRPPTAVTDPAHGRRRRIGRTYSCGVSDRE